MKVTQIAIGRFHHFHLARQLNRFGLLNEIWTGYPSFKLKDESGIERNQIKTFPWLHTLYMAKGRFGLGNFDYLDKELAWYAKESLDKKVARNLKEPVNLIALSGNGLHAGSKVKQLGGNYICDRGSAHIEFQNSILHEEYNRFGLKFKGIDSRVVNKELEEYTTADFITVPSEFSKKSFLKFGIPENKLVKIPYGANLDRFKPLDRPDINKFTILFVGNLSIQKGVIDLLTAFNLFEHPNKELIIVGSLSLEIKEYFSKINLTNIKIKGNISNNQLPYIYSKANVFVLPSIQEGFGMVIGEAMACGCPIIASENTGGSDLFTDGIEGFIVPIRTPQAIADKLQLLADNPILREEMSIAALNRVKLLGGWNEYGIQFANFIKSI
jgi:glycosyltransferase involved in cell wall biosynthesis